MAETLSEDVGVVLLANSAATAGVLLIIIYIFGPVSGAHFNPVVTLSEALLGDRLWSDVIPYIATQTIGAAFGTVVANLMFDLDAVNVSTKVRAGSNLWLAEGVATYGLILVIFMLVRSRRTKLVAGAVASYIGAAYWFTASTSFANPAVTVARTLSDTFRRDRTRLGTDVRADAGRGSGSGRRHRAPAGSGSTVTGTLRPAHCAAGRTRCW